jgi:site-specific DNA recombinase
MRAAIYCRKSTEQSGVHESEKSVTHQRERCEELIHAKGWTLSEVYTEAEGTSGALFGDSRPELARLLVAVKAKSRPFDVVVAYDESRLGRDVIETGYLVKQILDSDIRLFFSDGTERRLDSATDALMLSIQNFGAQFERERASVRVRDKMRAKATAGHATGSLPFGYRAVEVNSHKELVPDPAHAEVVRRLFELYAAGRGFTAIAHELNREHPRGGRAAWSGPTVREMLANRIYIGEIVYGKTRFLVKKGKSIRVRVPEAQWIREEKPELRIVPEALWKQAQAQHTSRRASYLRAHNGQLQGRPDRESKHLLQGFVVCDACGGKMVVWSTAKKGISYRYLSCWRHKAGGSTACANSRGVRLDTLTEQVVTALKQHVTAESAAQAARELAEDADSSPERVAARREAIKADIGRLEQQLGKLVEAVADGGEVKSLTAAIKAKEAQREELVGRLGQLDTTQAVVAQWTAAGHLERVEALLADWREALDGTPAVGRQVLRKLLVTPIRVYETEWGTSWAVVGTFGAVVGHLSAEPMVTLQGHGPAHVITALDPDHQPADLSAELKALVETVGANGSPGGPTS